MKHSIKTILTCNPMADSPVRRSTGLLLRAHDTAPFATLAAALAIVGSLLGAAVYAQSSPESPANECAKIEDDTDRLDCYDRALRGAAEASSSPAAPTAPDSSSNARETPRDAVATRPPAPAAPTAPTARSAPRAPAADDAAEAEVIPIVVVAMREMNGGNIVFTTANGERWVQTDGRQNYYPKVPFEAEIKPGAMNSHFLVPNERGRSVRVRRAE
jgi:hypothetical protein